MTTFGKDLWIALLGELTYLSERDVARLRELREDQLALIEELLHRQALKLNNRTRLDPGVTVNASLNKDKAP